MGSPFLPPDLLREAIAGQTIEILRGINPDFQAGQIVPHPDGQESGILVGYRTIHLITDVETPTLRAQESSNSALGEVADEIMDFALDADDIRGLSVMANDPVVTSLINDSTTKAARAYRECLGRSILAPPFATIGVLAIYLAEDDLPFVGMHQSVPFIDILKEHVPLLDRSLPGFDMDDLKDYLESREALVAEHQENPTHPEVTRSEIDEKVEELFIGSEDERRVGLASDFMKVVMLPEAKMPVRILRELFGG